MARKKGCSHGRRLKSGKCPSKKQAAKSRKRKPSRGRTVRESRRRTRHAHTMTTRMMPTFR